MPVRFNPTYRAIFAAGVTVGVMTAFVLVATVIRDLVIAYRFGIGDVVDAFFMALLLPGIAVQVIAVSLATAAVPQLIRLQNRDEAAAAALAANIGVVVVACSLLATAGLALLSGPIVELLSAGFSPEKAALTRWLFVLLLPSIILQGWSTFVGGLINARRRFGIVAAAPAFRPLMMIAALMLPTDDPTILVAGLLGGLLLEAVLVSTLAVQLGLPVLPRWHGLDTGTRVVLKEFGPAGASTLIMALAQFATLYLASLLPAGSVAALSYGNKVVSLVIGLCALPISTAVLPHFSLLASQEEWLQLRAVACRITAVLLACTVPLALACAAFSGPIVSLLFERGAFTESDTAYVAQIQAFLVLQLPFYLTGILWVRVLTALQRNFLLALVAVVNAGTSIIASLILMRSHGAAGIALGVSLGHVVAPSFAGFLALSLLRARQLRYAESIRREPSPLLET